MIPLTLTAAQAQQLLELGRARLEGPECLRTARAIYYWDAVAQVYACEADIRAIDPEPSAGLPFPPLERWGAFWRRHCDLNTPGGRLGFALRWIGGSLVLGAVVWWAWFFQGAEGTSPCLYTWNLACEWQSYVPLIAGRTLYQPALFWLGGVVGGLGVLLEWCFRTPEATR